MKMSISKSAGNIWAWMLWGLGIYLALELGPFFMVRQALNKTSRELIAPYLAFALPAVIVLPLIWWLRKREETGAAPKRLARMWGLSAAVFIAAISAAIFYSCVKLRLVDANFLAGSFIAATLMGVLIVYFTVYHRALSRISARSVEGKASIRPK